MTNEIIYSVEGAAGTQARVIVRPDGKFTASLIDTESCRLARGVVLLCKNFKLAKSHADTFSKHPPANDYDASEGCEKFLIDLQTTKAISH